mmetsp:Transcript_11889/g.25520  ORF Transcript_11889/g.25520 Transcript_11889/m.25520 type:complete len:267 (-) Transcript_11889:1328-2128(-)|eukprot:CAMPEP_0202901374 /NCGR_PEP_ID=MMETSP1392-20130828/14210_1 /ASSEMBLY_ACC=CAM_ASM_000868 /TAXON_ID=225041 /ORGANISM="Chlamydomonas chlamydogama, Strain SAG 11-48b" /LENGTH=266 /DNA_ID=CAMNT_0049587925 /DNA_START=100 /DNA_END=900 /DNA_ORIENTATION=-
MCPKTIPAVHALRKAKGWGKRAWSYAEKRFLDEEVESLAASTSGATSASSTTWDLLAALLGNRARKHLRKPVMKLLDANIWATASTVKWTVEEESCFVTLLQQNNTCKPNWKTFSRCLSLSAHSPKDLQLTWLCTKLFAKQAAACLVSGYARGTEAPISLTRPLFSYLLKEQLELFHKQQQQLQMEQLGYQQQQCELQQLQPCLRAMQPHPSRMGPIPLSARPAAAKQRSPTRFTHKRAATDHGLEVVAARTSLTEPVCARKRLCL